MTAIISTVRMLSADAFATLLVGNVSASDQLQPGLM